MFGFDLSGSSNNDYGKMQAAQEAAYASNQSYVINKALNLKQYPDKELSELKKYVEDQMKQNEIRRMMPTFTELESNEALQNAWNDFCLIKKLAKE